jgi:hypothetical protein
MSTFDTELRERLAGLANGVPASNLVEQAVSAGHRRQRGRYLTAAVSSLVLAGAVIAIPISVHTSSSRPRQLHLGVQQMVPALSSGLQFDVAEPDRGGSEALPPNNPPCTPHTAVAQAFTRAFPYGVNGVINLRGSRCSLAQAHITGIFGSHKGYGGPTPADVTIRPAPSSGPFGRPDLLLWGDGSIGFTWTGSWCETAAPLVRIALPGGNLYATITGPTPGCRGDAQSEVTPGAVAAIGAPSQGPPTEWTSLSAQVSVNGTNTATTLNGVSVRFTNPTGSDVWLSPTPVYIIGVEDRNGDGTDGEVIQPLPYKSNELLVPAYGSLSLSLPPVDISPDAANFVSPRILVSFAISGVPSTQTTTTIPFCCRPSSSSE